MEAKELLEKYRQDRKHLLGEVRTLDAMIRRLEADLGEPPDTSDDKSIAELSLPAEEGPFQQPPLREWKFAADEFFGMTQGEAAQKYLEKIGRAVSLEQLIDALTKGGCQVGGADPKRTLYISLIRNTRDFVKVPSGHIGLRKFYPNLKTGADKARNKTKTAKKKAKKRK